jgi:protein SCO1/2
MNRSRGTCEDAGVNRAIAVVLALLASVATACGAGTPAAGPTPVTLHGAAPEPTGGPRPEFSLVDTSGASYDFGASTHGRVTLLYAGYTHCPDECPTSMADVAAALRQVPPSVEQQIRVVFVTTDPWRDNAKVLRRWLDAFRPPHPYVGLTGTPSQVAGAEVAMGIPIATRTPAKKGSKEGRYSVSHFAGVLVYGRDDRLKTLYPSGVAPSDMAADLEVLVKG